MRASGRSILLTTTSTGMRCSRALRSTKRVWGSGPSEASTSSSARVDHRQRALHLATEVGVPGVSTTLTVTDVRPVSVVSPVGERDLDGGVLREDGDAALALEVVGVHDALVDVLVGAEGPGLPQHRVDQGGLAVVDVGDDGDVAQVVAQDGLGHGCSDARGGPAGRRGGGGAGDENAPVGADRGWGQATARRAPLGGRPCAGALPQA
jgi:hypothetical protein